MHIYGHRGASGRLPENSLAALLGAVAAGADGVEFDVRATADGVPVLLHDRDLARTTSGRGPIDEMTLATLATVQTADGGPIPTLAAALHAIGYRLRIDVELKQPGIEQAVLAVLRADARAPYLISAFDWECLRQIRRLDPAVPLWPLAMAVDESLLAAAAELKADGVALAVSGFDDSAANRLAQARLSVALWTVNDPEQARAARDRGVSILITDEPATMRQTLAGPS